MERKEVEEIIACLSQERDKFYYFKDRYALMLLTYSIGKGMDIQAIRKSPSSRLLERPAVREVLQKTGSRQLKPEQLASYWPRKYHCYRLSLGAWGNKKQGARFYNQTSRTGWNLVLRLNFSAEHDTAYRNVIQPQRLQPFQCLSHPISRKKGENTLAWARIDLDMERDEALIEEIQNDWIRMAMWSRQYIAQYGDPFRLREEKQWMPSYVRWLGCTGDALNRYLEEVLKPHIPLWDEAMLMAAVQFLKQEIGIKNIYYHTFDFGCRLKRIGEKYQPPRSIYTQLPARFCFKKTTQVPAFLLRNLNRTATEWLKETDKPFYRLAV
ncbi:hypothetical protein [Desulfogranum japonicum]|uniref:hypothetical protein n=1 Tax=Desulfogranum japonicum TaxID=231447 RepID=UPI0004282A88|nr:hypothetical protein [Desulfogranum japonicum]